MKKQAITLISSIAILTGSASSNAALPLLVVTPLVQWVGTALLVSPADELLVGRTLTLAGKQALKVAAKPKGPLVKSGPTRGKVRSRNLDGTWRHKRADAGVPR